MKNISFKIRLAEFKDIPFIVSFNKLLAMETENLTLDENILKSGVESVISGKAEAFYMIAENEPDNIPIASLMITKEWSDWRSSFIWWIQSVYVDSDYRRKGVYKALYEKVKKNASENRCCAIRLYVDENNSAAQKTYAGLGMKKSNYIIFEESAL